MSPRITQTIIDKVITFLDQGCSTKEIKNYIKNQTKLGKTQVNQAYNDIKDIIVEEELEEIDAFHKQTVEQAKATFNEKTGVAESMGRICTLDQLLEACQVDLEVWAVDTHTINSWESTSKNEEGERVPITLYQVKASLKKRKEYNSFKNLLKNWEPPKMVSFSPGPITDSDKAYVVVLNDSHFGAYANGKYMYSDPTWTTQDTVRAVDKYVQTITEDVLSRNYKFKECVLLSLGDILHSVSGKTARLTELKYDIIREEMFDQAFTSICCLIQRLCEIFGQVRVADIVGNHNPELDMALFRALAAYFRTEKNIKFEHLTTFPSPLRIGSTLILAHHGQHFQEKSFVPKDGKAREAYIQSLFLQRIDLLKGVKTKLFLQGDLHHFEQKEYSDFEFIMLGTSLGGDEHSSVNNWKNRARQSCLVLDDSGLREVIHCYFE